MRKFTPLESPVLKGGDGVVNQNEYLSERAGYKAPSFLTRFTYIFGLLIIASLAFALQLGVTRGVAAEGDADTSSSSAITNLAVSTTTLNSATLTWSSPGDDGIVGTSTSYDLRYGTSTITESNWALSAQATGEPTPLVASTTQSMIVTGLASSTTYYFAIKSSDEASNISALSNIASGATLAPTVPVLSPGSQGLELKVTPSTLNIASHGSWITVHLFLPNTYKASEIDLSSIKLNGVLSPDGKFRGSNYFTKGKFDKEKAFSNLTLKFSRAGFIGLVGGASGQFVVTLTGEIKGESFSVSDTIYILRSVDIDGDQDEEDNNEGAVIQTTNSPDVYIVVNGKKRHIPSPWAFEQLKLKWQQIKKVSQQILDSFPDDDLLQAAGKPEVYIIVNGMKRHVPSPEVFNSYGFDWSNISVVSADKLAQYPDVNLIRAAGDAKVYYLTGGKKQWIRSLAAFSQRGFNWAKVIIVNSTEKDATPEGGTLN